MVCSCCSPDLYQEKWKLIALYIGITTSFFSDMFYLWHLQYLETVNCKCSSA